MTTELSAFTGLIAPDQKVLDYCEGRRYAPRVSLGSGRPTLASLCSDEGAAFDQEHSFNIGSLKPQLSWGTVRNTVSTGMLQSPMPVMPPTRRRRQPGSARKTIRV